MDIKNEFFGMLNTIKRSEEEIAEVQKKHREHISRLKDKLETIESEEDRFMVIDFLFPARRDQERYRYYQDHNTREILTKKFCPNVYNSKDFRL